MPSPLTYVKGALGALILLVLMGCGTVSRFLTPPPTALPPGYAVSGKTMGDPNAKVTLVEFGDFQ